MQPNPLDENHSPSLISYGNDIITSDPKAGVRTSEFWLVLLANLIAVALVMLKDLPVEWGAGAITVLNAVYAVVRGLVKSAAIRANGPLIALLFCCVLGSLGMTSCTITLDPAGNLTAQPDPASVQVIATEAIRATK